MALPLVLLGAGVPAIASTGLWQVANQGARYLWKTTLFISFFSLVIYLVSSFIGQIVAYAYSLDTPIPDVVGQVFFWFLPENALTILTTIYLGKIYRLIYQVKVDVLNRHLAVYSRA